MAKRGGPLRPVKVIPILDIQENVGRYSLLGRVALKINGFYSSDRGVIGGKALVVCVITQAEIDSGEFSLQGGAEDMLISESDLPANRGEIAGRVAIPVYIMNDWNPVFSYFPMAYFTDTVWPMTEFYWPGHEVGVAAERF